MTSLREVLLRYFEGEQNAGTLCALVGVAGLVAGGVFLQPRWDLRGLGGVLLVVGLLQIAVGVGLARKTPAQVAVLEATMLRAPATLVREERTRMERVQRNFVVLEAVWITLLVGGAIAAVAAKTARPTVSAVAAGLVLEAAFFLAFDLVAERRGAAYLGALEAEAPRAE